MKRKDDLTKIVCTIGPACEKRETLKAMIKAGMDVARLNFSHGSHDWHFQAIINLRHAAYQAQKCLGIMADIQGPRIRIAELQDKKIKISKLQFNRGDRILLKENRSSKRLPGYLEKQILIDSDTSLLGKLKTGDKVYLDNGTVELTAEKNRKKQGWEMEVKNDGLIKTRKGINFPTLARYIPSFTSKDSADLHFALKQGVDFVALSFVKDANDIINLRKRMVKILGRRKGLPEVVAKIETLAALHNIKEILAVADAAMVARGDMGIEAPQEKVPLYQKLLIRHCIKNNIPVIVATNMLESMTILPRPTRAELTDVANAVIDRADSLMLSGETANGKYPVRSVATMSKIIKTTEKSHFDDQNKIPELLKIRSKTPGNSEEMNIHTIGNLTEEMHPKAIILSRVPASFITKLSNFRLNVPLLCYVGNHNPLTRKLILRYGVLPYPSESQFQKAVQNYPNHIFIEGKEKRDNWDYKIKITQRKSKK
ncbi:MAG: pyruvate kinase [Candidatus Moranbacteria bacterium]|nr:pyruvate kinase [Candidatus Moranbacteria bacterium]